MIVDGHLFYICMKKKKNWSCNCFLLLVIFFIVFIVFYWCALNIRIPVLYFMCFNFKVDNLENKILVWSYLVRGFANNTKSH